MILLKLIRESFLFAYDALRQNKLRTMLSLLGVTIGIFTIIAVFSAVDTLRNNLQKSVNKLGSNSIYVQKWPWVGEDNFPWWKYMQRPVPKLRDFDQLSRRSQTAKALSYEISIDNRTVKYLSNTVDGAQIDAVSHDHDKTWNFDFQDGRYFTDIESRTGAPVTIIGADIADALFPGGTGVGKQIKIMGRKVTIIGVFAKEGKDILGITSDNQILLPLNFAKNVIDIENEKYNPQIVVRGQDNLSDIEVESEVRGLMRSIHSIRPGGEDDFSLNKSTILTNQLDQLFGIVNVAGAIIGGFSILVGGFGIANIMFVSVKERTNIIGIQKSLGAKNYFILLQFLIEAISLCLMGGVIGLLLVYLGTLGVKAASGIEVVLDMGNIIFGIGISVAIGMISGIVPAWFASRLDPVEAIRTN
ncbi:MULTISPECIES: ABC transporter permease [unclassified Mucilaginibacter]|uniref:ABC transporter permease n=1 Tax=unclassified Mucilaginibacter TaxID=2617802 RepID=UPI002AC9978B|nr:MULTISPECIES: ABC transporter permease [unclassified Mucilaginibacter]MEB0261538.1 ABC transporter permease [Mucilaginibacter sp. 10I4]MEB0277825.1 ABC transporter permease [Mucilaginibacter sp. 10B2]MEB0300628.1 ABC transporter permease [Mucilaginibacter sp. 5C4]WPX22718.1 ABC transporter permease [Mucilaginibacter sp. 5C4]